MFKVLGVNMETVAICRSYTHDHLHKKLPIKIGKNYEEIRRKIE